MVSLLNWQLPYFRNQLLGVLLVTGGLFNMRSSFFFNLLFVIRLYPNFIFMKKWNMTNKMTSMSPWHPPPLFFFEAPYFKGKFVYSLDSHIYIFLLKITVVCLPQVHRREPRTDINICSTYSQPDFTVRCTLKFLLLLFFFFSMNQVIFQKDIFILRTYSYVIL